MNIDHIQIMNKYKIAKGETEGTHAKNTYTHLGDSECQQKDKESDTERQSDRRGSMPSLTNVQTTVHQYDNEQVV